MRITHKIAAGLCTACAAVSMLAAVPSAAGTIEDVYQAMRDVNLPESYIINARNWYETMPHDENGMTIDGQYVTYDLLEALVISYQEQIFDEVSARYGIPKDQLLEMFASAPAQTTAPQGGDDPAVTTVTTAAEPEWTPSIVTDKPFLSMTPEERLAYFQSLPEDERARFYASLTPAEQKQLLKDLSTDAKTNLIQGAADLAGQMGMNVTVDEIDGNDISLSIRDSEGTLVDTASLGGASVDDTGWDMRLPVFGGAGMLLCSLAGFGWLAFREYRRQENVQEVQPNV